MHWNPPGTAIALLLAACGASFHAQALDLRAVPSPSLDCAAILSSAELTDSERLELIVDLAYHSIQAQHPGLRLSGTQNAVLGLVIEESCRQTPAADLGATVDLAVRIAIDAHPDARDEVAAR